MTLYTKKFLDGLIANNGTHYWVKDVIKIMMTKDPVDNLHNVAILKMVADELNK